MMRMNDSFKHHRALDYRCVLLVGNPFRQPLDAQISCEPLDAQIRGMIVTFARGEGNGVNSMSEVSEDVCEELWIRVDKVGPVWELLTSIRQQRLEEHALFAKGVMSSDEDCLADLETKDPSLLQFHT